MTDWQLCTSGAAISKAGLNANSTIAASGSALLGWYTEAEGSISAEIHTDATGVIQTGQISGALSDICSSKIAMRIIMFYWLKSTTLTRNFKTNMVKSLNNAFRNKKLLEV